jgi:Aspartyl protease/gag-polyprotein putative aspartyl protease
MTNPETSRLSRRALAGGAIGAALAGNSLISGPSLAQRSQDRVVVPGQTPTINLQTWVDRFGRPTAEVMLNGRGPYKFIVDTASTTSVVSSRLATALNLPELAPRQVHSVTGTSLERFARTQTIRTGRSVKEDASVAVMDSPAFEKLDGILGMDMFKDRKVRFNFTRRSVHIESAARREASLPVTSRFKLHHGLLIETDVRVGGVRGTAMVDTGGSTTIINTAMLNAFSTQGRYWRGRPQEQPVLFGANNQEIMGIWARMPEIAVMGLRTRGLTVIVSDVAIFDLWDMAKRPAMLLGMDVLTQLDTLVIDYRRREMQIKLLANMVERGGINQMQL